MQRSSSFLFSLIFHLSIVVLVIFWPAPEPRKGEPLTGAMVQGIVTIGKAGGPAKARPKETPKDTAPVSKVDDSAPKTEEKITTAQPRVDPTPQVAPPKEVKPVEKTPEPPKVEPKAPPQKPVESPDAVKIPEKRVDKPKDKPKEKPQEKPKEKPKDKPKDKAQPEAPKKPVKDTKPTQKKGSAAQQALADLNKDEKKKPSGGGSGASAANALKALESELGGGDGSGTASGSGYGEGGYGDSALIGSYTDSLVSRIRPNWSWTGLAVRQALQATFRIKIAPDGTIESHELVESSGNSNFDATVTKAIALTRQVEPPPSSIPNGEVVVIFRPDALMQ